MSYASRPGDIDRRLRRFNKHQLMVIPWKSGGNPPPLEKDQIVVGFDIEARKMKIQVSDGDGIPLVDGDEYSLALARRRQIESLKEKLGAFLASHTPTEADHAAIRRDTLELVGHELVGRERKRIAQRIRAFAGQLVSKVWGSLKTMGSGLRRADLDFVLFWKLVFRVGLILGLFWLAQFALRPIKPSAYLPTQGSDEDRWWCAVLILTISAISASLFLLIGFTLAVVPVAARPINWRILVTVLGLGLFGLAAESTWRVVTSEDLTKTAGDLWKADVQAAMIRLVSELDVQWRDANAAPIVFGERPRNSAHPLPPIRDQITAHKNRLDRWNKAAERVLKSLDKVDSIVVVAVNKTIESAVMDHREGRVSQDAAIDPPGPYILQVADAGDSEPANGRFEKTTDNVLGGTDTAELWTVLDSNAVDQLNSAVLTELEQPRSIMLSHAAELRGRQMGAVADVLSWTARRTDRLRFRLGVHPLLVFANDPTEVNKLLLDKEGEAFSPFLSSKMFNSFYSDRNRSTEDRWCEAFTILVEKMCQKLATPRGQVYQIAKVMRDNAEVRLRTRIKEAGGKDDRLQRLGQFIPELPSLTLSYTGTSVQAAANGLIAIKDNKASERAKKRLMDLIDPKNNGQELRDLSIEERVRTLYEMTADLDPELREFWREDLKKLRAEIDKWKQYVNGLRKFDDRVTSHVNGLGNPFEPFRPTVVAGIAKIRDELASPPRAEDLLRAVADYSQPRARLGDEARDLAWKYLHLTPSHPLVRKNPERMSSGKAEPTLADKILSVWDEELKHVPDVELLSENGVERTANRLAGKGREILAIFFNDIADSQANAWHRALNGLTTAPAISRDAIAKESIEGAKPAQIANFWQIGPAVASLPYWLKGHWRDPVHAADYESLLAATDGPKDLKPYKNITRDSEEARTAVMEHHKLWWDKWIPDLLSSFGVNSPETYDRMAIVKRCSAYWGLVTAGGDGPGYNPFADALVVDNALGNPLAGDTQETLQDRIKQKKEPDKYVVEDLAKKLSMSIFETAKMLDKRNSDFEFRDKYVEQAIRKSLEEQKAKEAAKQPSQGGERQKPPEATTQPASNEKGPK